MFKTKGVKKRKRVTGAISLRKWEQKGNYDIRPCFVLNGRKIGCFKATSQLKKKAGKRKISTKASIPMVTIKKHPFYSLPF